MKLLFASWVALALLFSASLVPSYPAESTVRCASTSPLGGAYTAAQHFSTSVSAFAEADDKKADPPTPAVVLPDAPPVPAPPPKPDPSLPTVLAADAIYLIRANVNCTVVEGVEGLVKITYLKGPVTFAHTKFTDGTGFETRTVSEPYVYFVEAVGKGPCDLIIIPDGGKPIRRKLDVGGVGPGPVPPVPPNPPDPPLPPDPFQSGVGDTVLRVLIVYESADLQKYPVTQLSALQSDVWRKYVEGKSGNWRCWDKDVDLTSAPSPFKKAMGKARATLPYIFVGNGKAGFAGPMPTTLDDLNKLLAKFGG